MARTIEERFWSKVDTSRGPQGCWLWLAGLNRSGYGKFGVNGKTLYAHRVAYTLSYGSIPEGLQVDHVKDRGCTEHSCVNPAHLEAVTQQINVLRGDGPAARNARKTHCPQGHALTGTNLRIDHLNRRSCRTCLRQHQRNYDLRRRHQVTREAA